VRLTALSMGTAAFPAHSGRLDLARGDSYDHDDPSMVEVRNAYVTARTSMRPSWMRVW
jgi:hypothetical protein